MENIMVETEYMRFGFVVIPLIFFYFMMSFIKNDTVKWVLYFIKSIAYFGLAWFMWKYYKGKEQIDILSFFTFIFCCFESADNLISMFEIPINKIRNAINENRKYKLKEMELEMKRKR